jgi:hypothetical protein
MMNRTCVVRCVPLSYDVDAETITIAAPAAPEAPAMTLPLDCLISVGDGSDAMANALRAIILRRASETMPHTLASGLADKVISDFLGVSGPQEIAA